MAEIHAMIVPIGWVGELIGFQNPSVNPIPMYLIRGISEKDPVFLQLVQSDRPPLS